MMKNYRPHTLHNLRRTFHNLFHHVFYIQFCSTTLCCSASITNVLSSPIDPQSSRAELNIDKMVKQIVKSSAKVVKSVGTVVFRHKENLCLLAAVWGMCDDKQRTILTVRESDDWIL